MTSTALIVLGMHRSGTSAFTGSLKCLGVELGQSLYQGHAEINAKGYWEHGDIVDTHDEILRLLGSRWDDINPLPDRWELSLVLVSSIENLEYFIQRDFSKAAVWGLKDPRMCRLLPLWNRIFEKKHIKPFYAFVIRDPFEVARSLKKRNQFAMDRGLYLWLDHNIQAEKHSRGQPRVFFTYDQLLNDPKSVFETLENKLEAKLPISVAEGWSCIETFIETDLRHHNNQQATQTSELEEIAFDLFKKLKDLSQKEFTEQDALDLSGIYQRFEAYQNSLPNFLLQNIADLNKDYAHIQGLWQEAYYSYTWLIMKPVRFIERTIKRVLKKL